MSSGDKFVKRAPPLTKYQVIQLSWIVMILTNGLVVEVYVLKEQPVLPIFLRL